MLSIFLLMAGVAMAGTLIPAEDHLECTESGVEEMQCWPAQTAHDLLSMCSDSACPIGQEELHVHVEPAESVAMVQSAPWSTFEPAVVEPSAEPSMRRSSSPEPRQREAGTVTVRSQSGNRYSVYDNRDGSRRPPQSRPTGVYTSGGVQVVTQPAYVNYAPVYYGGSQNSFQASETALGDWQAINEDWVAGIRAENQGYQNEAKEAEQRARKAEVARKVEESRRLAAQARAVEAEGTVAKGKELIGDLAERNAELAEENERLRSSQTKTTEGE